jgi:hypothetical protein
MSKVLACLENTFLIFRLRIFIAFLMLNLSVIRLRLARAGSVELAGIK